MEMYFINVIIYKLFFKYYMMEMYFINVINIKLFISYYNI